MNPPVLSLRSPSLMAAHAYTDNCFREVFHAAAILRNRINSWSKNTPWSPSPPDLQETEARTVIPPLHAQLPCVAHCRLVLLCVHGQYNM